MKICLIAFAVISAVAADVSHLPLNEYLPPAPASSPNAIPSNEYLPPGREVPPAHELANDGYHYNTHRRVVYVRNRRDVSHLPASEYLPAAREIAPMEVIPVEEVSNSVIEESVPAHELGEDGYRYKTRTRVAYRRHRRDVSHLPSNEYLPPSPPIILDAPVQQDSFVPEAAPAHELAEDGYHYRTRSRVIRRRHRRDVSHLPSNEYLPASKEDTPADISPLEEMPIIEEPAPAPAPAHELAEDGYRYKTQRKVVLRRHRRDVSHLPSSEYLPPNQPASPKANPPTNEYLPPNQPSQPEPAPAHELTSDGYRYNTRRRVVFRRH